MAENRLDRHTVALLTSVVCASSAALAMTTVLGKQVYDMTGRQLDLGLLGLVEFAPAALLVLVTGSVADRFDRRRVGAMAAGGEALAAAGLAWYAGTKPTSVGPIFLLVFGFGVARAFSAPSTRALPADMVPPSRMPWLIARYSGMWQTAIVVGPVLGGFLYAVDVRLPYVAAMVLLTISGSALLSIKLTRRAHSPAMVASAPAMEAAVEPSLGHGEAAPVPERAGLRDAMEGLRFIRRHPLLLGAISLDLFAVLFGGAVALLPAIAKDRLGVGAVGLGWLRAAGGLGAGAVTIGLAMRPLRQRVGRTLLMAVAAFGIFTVVLGVTRSFVVAFLAMAVLSGADAISVFVRATLVPLVTPADKRGRVLAVENVFIGASNELGAFESGVAGQLLGTAGAVMLGGLATLAVAGSWFFLFPALRDVDGFPGNTD
ncbi:MAG TPA: MFS transporter [Acidimicrobiales bacterium]|nr:MFS transporter [Acidimicrobiales bacterium]